MGGKILKIGTRGSRLALRQVEMVRSELKKIRPDLQSTVITIKTSGDWRPDQGESLLAETGGKGQFAKEIEAAMLRGEIDCAVHSMKDMETVLPEGLAIKHMLPREDPRDALLSKNKLRSSELPAGAVVGSASVRRQAMLLAIRPDLKMVPLRGNVETRIAKMKDGQVDATVLAYAGLKRLGLEEEIAEIFSTEVMLPSAGQGAVGVECRAEDKGLLTIFDQISDEETVLCVSAERGVLRALGGSCQTPVGAYAVLENGQINLQAKVVSPDGRQVFERRAKRLVASPVDATMLGEEVGNALLKVVPKELL